jgi:CHAT domain-containing protein
MFYMLNLSNNQTSVDSSGNVSITSKTITPDLMNNESGMLLNTESLKKALDNYQQIPDVNDRLLRSSLAIGNLGELLRRTGQLDEAERVLSDGLDTLLLNPFDSIRLAQLYINRGETFFDQKKYQKALKDYDQVLACLVPNYIPKKNGQLPALNLPIRNRNDFQLVLGDIALTNLSLWEEGKGKDPHLLQRAATVYDTLFKLINITRGDFISDDEKLNLAQKSQLTLRKAAWCSAKLAELFPKRKDYYWQQAFQIAEQSKAFALIEAARLKNVSNNLDPAFRAEEQDLLEQYSLIENELLSARNDPKRLAVLTVDKSEVVDKIRIHQQRLKQQYPNYYALKYRGADLSVDKIQKQVLGADQALVAYYFQDSALSIFVVTPNTFLLKSVPIREDSLQSLVNTYLELLSSNRSNKEAAIAKYGSQLYSMLLQPVAGMLPERLILVPAGPLNNLPFEALLIRPQVAPFKEQLKNKNFVLSRYAISYCFSANLLYEMQQAQLPKQVLSIPAIMAANFQQFQAGKASTQTNLSSFLRQSASYLTPLGVPQKQEVDGILKVIPQAQKYLKLSATKQDFFAASKNSSIIHAPTHGILNPTDPSQSFIAFSQHGDSLRRSELLFVNELYSRFFNVDLIFLSACQTATGKFIAGEGNISLGRGLAYAGVRSFISTLWNVPVAPKASIAGDFYQSFLLQHQPKDVALAKAKRLAAEQYPDPNDWAGFVLQGACLPATTKTNYWLIVGIGLALLFLLVFGFRMMAKRRKTLARA